MIGGIIIDAKRIDAKRIAMLVFLENMIRQANNNNVIDSSKTFTLINQLMDRYGYDRVSAKEIKIIAKGLDMCNKIMIEEITKKD